MIIMIFDLETNGFKGSSVLQFTGVKLKYDGKNFKKIASMNEYYLPREKFNKNAYKVHKISIEKIKEEFKKRYKKLYMEQKEELGHNFENVKDDLKKSLKGLRFFENDVFVEDFISDVDVFVGHNIKTFDMKFLPCHLGDKKDFYIFDTMLLNIEEMKLPYKNGKFKSPKLQEACKYYGVEYDEEKAHDSKYDVLVNTNVFRRMLNKNKFKEILNEGFNNV
ncbi:MAG: hypothetical protein ACOC1K_00025 [Nanoarchaeota archaeon]